MQDLGTFIPVLTPSQSQRHPVNYCALSVDQARRERILTGRPARTQGSRHCRCSWHGVRQLGRDLRRSIEWQAGDWRRGQDESRVSRRRQHLRRRGPDFAAALDLFAGCGCCGCFRVTAGRFVKKAGVLRASQIWFLIVRRVLEYHNTIAEHDHQQPLNILLVKPTDSVEGRQWDAVDRPNRTSPSTRTLSWPSGAGRRCSRSIRCIADNDPGLMRPCRHPDCPIHPTHPRRHMGYEGHQRQPNAEPQWGSISASCLQRHHTATMTEIAS